MRAWSRWALDAALAVAAITALVILGARPASPGVEVELRAAPGALGELRVHVAGAVVRPGVVALEPGSRVADAVALAGGATSDADLDALNLSRRVTDEDHIVVLRRGERVATTLLDLNRATARQLEALPGVGKVTAEAILASRQRQPFASSDDLLSRSLTTARVCEQIRDLVTVR